MKRRSRSSTTPLKVEKHQKTEDPRKASSSIRDDEAPFDLPRQGDLLELRWVLSESVQTSEGHDRTVWWPAIVVKHSSTPLWELVYTAEAEAHDASELLQYKADPGKVVESSEEIQTEQVVFRGYFADHLLSGNTVTWRFASWRDSAQSSSSKDAGGNSNPCVAVARAQEILAEEAAVLRATLHRAISSSGVLGDFPAREAKSTARRILRTFVRLALEDALRGGNPQQMKAALESEENVVFPTVLCTRRSDCTLGQMRAVFEAIIEDMPPDGRERISAFTSAHVINFPSPRQSEPIGVRFRTYGDLCSILGVPMHSRALKAGKTRPDAVAVVGSTVLLPRQEGEGGSQDSTTRKILVGHSCVNLFNGCSDASAGVLPSWDVVTLHQDDTTYLASERRSKSLFVVEKVSTADLQKMSRTILRSPIAEHTKQLDFEHITEELDEEIAPEFTFDLSWLPLPISPGTVFEAGAVPGSLTVRVPVVVVRSAPLICSLEQQLLEVGDSQSEEEKVRSNLRSICISPPHLSSS